MKTYEDGLNDAWEVFRRLEYELTSAERVEFFGYYSPYDIIGTCTPQEIIKRLEKYDEIKVGDEVEYISTSDRGVVEHISKFTQTISVMWDNGSIGEASIKKFKKTGRHFPQIEEVLKLMQKDKYD